MRSPRWTGSFCCTHGTMRRAIKPAIKRTPIFSPQRLDGLEADQHIFIELAPDSAFSALRYWPGVCLK